MNSIGWVDLQVNGYCGVDFSSAELTTDSFLYATDELLKSGTDIFLPTIITSSPEVYQQNLPLIAQAVATHGLQKHIVGVHLEGPFLANTAGYVGCHNPKYTQPPYTKEFDKLVELSGGMVKLITVAATDSSSELIEYITKNGVVVSVGHHNASVEHLALAVKAGAKSLTHLGNGVPNELPRHENPIFAGLANDDLIGMCITDGHHLPPQVIKCALRCKGVDRFIVVSDASPAAGLPAGRYNVLGNDAILEESGRLYNPEKNCLVGSGCNMTQCMNFLASLNLLSSDELIKVGRTNALKMIGLDNE